MLGNHEEKAQTPGFPDYHAPDAIRARHGWPRDVYVLPEAHRLADEVAAMRERLG